MFNSGNFLPVSGYLQYASESVMSESVQKYPKSAVCETRWKLGSGTTEQKVFEVKGCATGCGNLCNLVVWRKCSKAGAFPALWWLSGTVYSGECLKVPEKCGM